ncbi:hypothetical protein BDV19DRAFT_40009 [Aspergillus venezuelensis]
MLLAPLRIFLLLTAHLGLQLYSVLLPYHPHCAHQEVYNDCNMAWSIEEIVSFITMIITLPAFIIACRALMKWYRRRKNKKLEPLNSGYMPLATSKASPSQPIHISLMDDPGDLEQGWVEFQHVTTSTMSRSGSFRLNQLGRRD